MSLHKEVEFENDICDYLSTYDWLYEKDDAKKYDRARALFPEDLRAWIESTQPKAWGDYC